MNTNIFKFKLVEDLLLEYRRDLYTLIKAYIDYKEPGVLCGEGGAGLTALKKYLCLKRGVPFSEELVVHHINCNHNDYSDNNLCLMWKKDHRELHGGFLTKIISEYINYYGTLELKNKKEEDITINDLNLDLLYEYCMFQLYTAASKFRLDH